MTNITLITITLCIVFFLMWLDSLKRKGGHASRFQAYMLGFVLLSSMNFTLLAVVTSTTLKTL